MNGLVAYIAPLKKISTRPLDCAAVSFHTTWLHPLGAKGTRAQGTFASTAGALWNCKITYRNDGGCYERKIRKHLAEHIWDLSRSKIIRTTPRIECSDQCYRQKKNKKIDNYNLLTPAKILDVLWLTGYRPSPRAAFSTYYAGPDIIRLRAPRKPPDKS